MNDDRKSPTNAGCVEYLDEAELEIEVEDEEGIKTIHTRKSIANHGAY